MLRAILIVIALCGCRDDAVEQVQRVRDEVCACKTARCGEEAMKKLPSKDVQPKHREKTLANEMMNCMAKLYLKRGTEDATKP